MRCRTQARVTRRTVAATFVLATVAASAAIAAPQRAADRPKNTATPTLEGEFREGERITTTNGQWENNPTSFTYRWLRCNAQGLSSSCATISGETSKSYRLRDDDVDHRVTALVTARNSDGERTVNARMSPIISSRDAPRNTQRPGVSGLASVGSTLSVTQGVWTGGVTSYTFQWYRCSSSGDQCEKVAGATARTYGVRSADVGHTLRAEVTAKNASGSTTVKTDRSPVVQPGAAPPPPPPSPQQGCQGGGRFVNAASLQPPVRLLVDKWRFDPPVVTRGTRQIVGRIHISDTCGRSVASAGVWSTAIPYNQLSLEQRQTAGDGWATLVYRVLPGFPANPGRQQILAVLIRATKPGGSVLAGVSTRRVVSVSVRE